MFDFSWSEVALIVIVALIFIGPKDLPVAIRAVSRAFKAVRRMASEFQSHVDDLIKEADLGDATMHLRDLDPRALRHRFLDTLDADRSLRDSFDITPPPSLSSPTSAPSVTTQKDRVESALTHASEAPDAKRCTAQDPRADDEADSQDLPKVLPPDIARRIARERRQFQAPRFVPPVRVTHHGRRVLFHGLTAPKKPADPKAPGND